MINNKRLWNILVFSFSVPITDNREFLVLKGFYCWRVIEVNRLSKNTHDLYYCLPHQSVSTDSGKQATLRWCCCYCWYYSCYNIWPLCLMLLEGKKFLCPLLCHSCSFRISGCWQVQFKVERNKYKTEQKYQKTIHKVLEFLWNTMPYAQCNLNKYQSVVTIVSYQVWVHLNYSCHVKYIGYTLLSTEAKEN